MASSPWRNSPFLTGLIAGAIFGVAFSVLTTPRSGQETRQQVVETAEGVTTLVHSGPQAIRDRLARLIQDQVDRVQEAILAGQEAAFETERMMMEEYERTLQEARRTP